MDFNQLQHPDKNVRIKAALEVGSAGDHAALTALVAQLPLEPDFFVRENITWAIVRMGQQALPPMLELMRDRNPATRLQAIHVLSKLGDARAVDALMTALKDSDVFVVQKAVFALGQLKETRAVPALVTMLSDTRLEIRNAVVKTLEGFGRAALPTLEQAMQDSDWRVREQAANLIGFQKHQAAVPTLAKALKDDRHKVRFAAVTALGNIQNQASRDALKLALEDDDKRVRLIAARYLEWE